MVVGCALVPSSSDIELAFYDKFFFSRDLEPYPVQEKAFEKIFAGASVLVTVPTGTGKTLMAKAGIFRALALGRTAVYTTPLRALTEEKYRELVDDFGADKVGFATGDYKVNPEAPIQVVVAEILWNRVYGDRATLPADIVIMDEGHYFNDPERGYVWEQSIIGLDPRSQLVILSATIGDPEQFCAWVYSVRRVEMELVASTERKVPLYHEWREKYLIEVVRELHENGETPAIIFGFGREQCFERARLLKSCPRFTTDEERVRIAELTDSVLLDGGGAKELKPLLLHGIGIHHAGILPRYKQMVEKLALDRLVKFVVSTETISAGINLPAKRVVFPELRKVIKGKPRLLLSAEYHQMSGRAGRPQFDKEGIAITLAPEEVVQEMRKELKQSGKSGPEVEERIRRSAYTRAKAAAGARAEVTWDPVAHQQLVNGKPAPLKSQTRVTAEQILAIGLPDLLAEPAPPGPPYLDLNVRTVIANLYVEDKAKREAGKLVDMIAANLQALGVLDEHGAQIAGEMIGKIRGLDGTFLYYLLKHHDPTYEICRQLVELLVEHDVIHKVLSREADQERRQAILLIWREKRRDQPQLTFEDIEEEYDKEHPRPLSDVERIHQEFVGKLPHPELHGGKVQKNAWRQMEDEGLSFLEFVEKNGLAHEEGSLFTYLARLMKAARMIWEVTTLDEWKNLEDKIRQKLAAVDDRVIESLWA